MFAVAAVVVFVLSLLEVELGSLNLVTLGLALIAAHLAFGTYAPFPRGRSRG
ncbi:MAG TPA: hypothetical protein VNA14_05775 [Mycobacteriales bacterium]|nr:hypothetical protein [Mycobacteriales bacterium]